MAGAKALRLAMLNELQRTKSLILVNFSEAGHLDDYAVCSLLAIAFIAAHQGQWLGLFGFSHTQLVDLAHTGLKDVILNGRSTAEAYEELCIRRKDDPIGSEPPSFDILQFVREEVESGNS